MSIRKRVSNSKPCKVSLFMSAAGARMQLVQVKRARGEAHTSGTIVPPEGSLRFEGRASTNTISCGTALASSALTTCARRAATARGANQNQAARMRCDVKQLATEGGARGRNGGERGARAATSCKELV